jgi:nucleoid-associated protein YgaU
MIRLTLLSSLALAGLVGVLVYSTDLTAPRPGPDTSAAPRADTASEPAPDRAATAASRPLLGAEPAAAPPPATGIAAPVADEGESLEAMTAGILAQLDGVTDTAARGAAPAATPAPEMEALTRKVIASLGGEADGAPDPSDLARLIRQAMAAGDGDAYVDAVLNEAVAAGEVEVERAFITGEGRVDTRALLSDLVQRSTGRAPAPAAPTADAPQPDPRQPAGDPGEIRVYTVQAGDSLGAIAQRFYGDAAAYVAIYEANRRILASPDSIRAGQRLILPDPGA